MVRPVVRQDGNVPWGRRRPDAETSLAERRNGYCHGLDVPSTPQNALRPIGVERGIASRILDVRGHRVMLDSDLAEIYGVPVKRLNEQVKRNRRRFPRDFMFQLTANEVTALRSQFATSKSGRGGRRSRPHVFTEHGAVMLATVLNSAAAIRASILVVRAFVRMRAAAALHRQLARKLDALELKYDGQFERVFRTLRELIQISPTTPRRPIGY